MLSSFSYKKITSHNFMFWAFLVALADQLTKSLAVYYLGDNTYTINASFDLVVYVNNMTMMLFFDDYFGVGDAFVHKLIYLSMSTVLALGFLIIFNSNILKESKHYTIFMLRVGFILLLGSTFGNSFDHIFRNGVIDFVVFKGWTNVMPIFNLADVFVWLGVVLLYSSIALLIVTGKVKKNRFAI